MIWSVKTKYFDLNLHKRQVKKQTNKQKKKKKKKEKTSFQVMLKAQ